MDEGCGATIQTNRRSGALLVRATGSESWKRLVVALALATTVVWYLVSTVPYIENYPMLDWPQMGIAAPAYKLASEGVYGNDLYTGFYHTELRNYEYMPAYPILVALSFKLFGLGVAQARFVSIVCGLATVLLTFELGRRYWGASVGLVGAAALCCLRLSPSPDSSGISLLDFSRVIRYDNLVPVLALAAVWAFLWALKTADAPEHWRRRTARVFLAGLLAGLATLSHLYGAFIIAVFAGSAMVSARLRTIRKNVLGPLVVGWFVGIAPWLAYVAQDYTDFQGQMSRHEGRFDLFNPTFYLDNLMGEYHRYGVWIGGFPEGLLRPRLGIWFMVTAVALSSILLLRRIRKSNQLPDVVLLLALPIQMLLLGLLLNLKRHVYVIVLLPFVALHVAVAIVSVWRWARDRGLVWRVGLVTVSILAVIEGATGVRNMLRVASQTTPYQEVSDALVSAIPPGSKLLISQPYWLGLAHYENRSINLVTIQRRTVPMERVIGDFSPNYVVVEREFFDEDRPAQAEDLRWWQSFHQYLQNACPDVVFTRRDPTYGTIDVWSCR